MLFESTCYVLSSYAFLQIRSSLLFAFFSFLFYSFLFFSFLSSPSFHVPRKEANNQLIHQTHPPALTPHSNVASVTNKIKMRYEKFLDMVKTCDTANDSNFKDFRKGLSKDLRAADRVSYLICLHVVFDSLIL